MTLQNLIDDPGLLRVILVEVQPFDLGTSAEILMGFTDGADAPLYNGFLWHERIQTSYSTNSTITQGGFDLGGFTTPTFGTITFNIADGAVFTDSLGNLKDLRELSWDGRRVRMLMGAPSDAFGDFEVVFDGLITDFTWGQNSFTLSIADKTIKVDDEIQIVTFAGTGVLEGGPDLKNQIKPLVYGIRKNIVPVLVDSFNQIYVINDGPIQAVDDVFDSAVQLENAGDIVTLGLPALTNWTAEGGRYITDLAQGAIRIGAEPAGQLTMDVQGDNSGTGYVTKTADIIERILLTRAGMVAGDIDTPSFDKFNLDFPGSAGFFVKDDVSIREVINTLLLNLNAFGITTPQGKIEIGIVDINVPGLTVDSTLVTVDSTLVTVDQTIDPDLIDDIFEDKDITAIVRQETANPVWRTEVGFKQVGRVQEIEDTEIPDNVASDPFNLLRDQAFLIEQVGDFTYVDKISLGMNLLQPVRPGEVLSVGIEFEDPTVNVTNLRIQVLFFDAGDVQVGTTVEGNFINTTQATTFIRSFVHSFAVPPLATKITIKTLSTGNGADVLSRRLMLNRGTLALPFIPSILVIEEDTVLPASVSQAEGTQKHNLGIGLSVDEANDGDGISFAVPWNDIPEIIPVGGGLTNNALITGDQELVFVALNLSTTGFTASAKNQSLAGGSPTVVTDSVESTPIDTVDEQIDKSVTNEADNDQYTIRVAVTVNTFQIGGEPPVGGEVSIGFYSFKNGVGYTKRAEVTYFSSGTKSKTITVDGLNSTADKWGVKLESKSPGDQTLDDIIDVTYSFGGTQVIASATPTGASKIRFQVIGGAEGGT